MLQVAALFSTLKEFSKNYIFDVEIKLLNQRLMLIIKTTVITLMFSQYFSSLQVKCDYNEYFRIHLLPLLFTIWNCQLDINHILTISTYLSLMILSRTSSASLSILESSPALLSVRSLEGVKLHTLMEESSKPQAISRESSLMSIQFILRTRHKINQVNK